MRKTLLTCSSLALCAIALAGCALCHGHEGSDGAAMQRHWDHSFRY